MTRPARIRPRQEPTVCTTRAEFLLHRPIAHRGLHDAAKPENSLAAVSAACDRGYPVEIDVHALRDGTIAVFHDHALARMTGARGVITDLARDDLATLRLGPTSEPIPILEQVLECVRGRVPLVVELKNAAGPGRLETGVWHRLRPYLDRFGPDSALVQSFNPLSLAWFRARAPAVLRGLLASDFADDAVPWHRRFLLRRLLLSPLVWPDYVGYALHCLPYWAPSLLRSLGCPLLAWTVRDRSDRLLAEHRADNFIFEHIRPELPNR